MGLVSATHVGVAVFENTGTELSFFDVSNWAESAAKDVKFIEDPVMSGKVKSSCRKIFSLQE
jgi:hypothetical protein